LLKIIKIRICAFPQEFKKNHQHISKILPSKSATSPRTPMRIIDCAWHGQENMKVLQWKLTINLFLWSILEKETKIMTFARLLIKKIDL